MLFHTHAFSCCSTNLNVFFLKYVIIKMQTRTIIHSGDLKFYFPFLLTVWYEHQQIMNEIIPKKNVFWISKLDIFNMGLVMKVFQQRNILIKTTQSNKIGFSEWLYFKYFWRYIYMKHWSWIYANFDYLPFSCLKKYVNLEGHNKISNSIYRSIDSKYNEHCPSCNEKSWD